MKWISARSAFDHTIRLARYTAGGWFTAMEQGVVEELIAAVGSPMCCQHGDPLLSMLTPYGCALVDFEHAARFVPGWDWALLQTMLVGQPAAQRRVAHRAEEGGFSEPARLLNRAMTLARENSHTPALVATPVWSYSTSSGGR